MKKNIYNLYKLFPVSGIGVLLLFVCLVLFTIFFFTRSTEYVEIRLFLTEREWAKTWENYPDYFYLENISTDLFEKDEIGRIVAEVTEIHTNRLPYTHNTALATVKLRANYNKNTQTYSFQGKPLIIGDYQRLRVGKMRLQGYLIDVGKELDPITTKNVRIIVELDDLQEADRNLTNSRAIGVSNELASFLVEGKTINNFENEPILRIDSVSLSPGERKIFDNSGIYTISDDSLISGVMQLSIKADVINGIQYWNFSEPIQLGRRMVLHFDGAIVPVKVIEILE